MFDFLNSMQFYLIPANNYSPFFYLPTLLMLQVCYLAINAQIYNLGLMQIWFCTPKWMFILLSLFLSSPFIFYLLSLNEVIICLHSLSRVFNSLDPMESKILHFYLSINRHFIFHFRQCFYYKFILPFWF